MVRTKFYCNYKGPDGSAVYVQLAPVVSFFQVRPGGHVSLLMMDETEAAQFEVGQEYYVDFTPAPKAA